MYSVIVCVCVCACVLCVSTCVFLPLCLCDAFIHVPPVTSSPVWTVNTGKFEVRLTRACVGCHLLSLLSQIKELGGHGSRWGEKGALSLSLSHLTLFLALSRFSQSWLSRRGGRKERCGTAASVLWLLASACWLICLLTTFEFHNAWDWQWFPPRRQFEHINIISAAWSWQAECH